MVTGASRRATTCSWPERWIKWRTSIPISSAGLGSTPAIATVRRTCTSIRAASDRAGKDEPVRRARMNDHLRERIVRKLETLSDERGYQVLDYVEFIESRYAER